MGEVYRARDTRLGRVVALKLLSDTAARQGPAGDSAAKRSEPQRLTTSKNPQGPIHWHPDGKYILLSEERRGTGSDLLLPIDVGANGVAKVGTPEELVATPASEMSGAFLQTESGSRTRRTSPGRTRSTCGHSPAAVSTDGAEWIEWRQGGLFYRLSEEVVMRVPYRVDGATLVAEKPELWMRIPQGVLWVDPPVTRTRAAMIRADDKRRVVLVVNFFDELRSVAPADR